MAAADGLAVVVLRHERKGGGEVGESGRGSSAFAGAVDIVLAVRRGEGNTRPTVRVIHALSRFDETPETLVVELTEAGYVALGDEGQVALREARDAVLAELTGKPDEAAEPTTFKELQLRLATVKRTTLQTALDTLVAEGTATRTGAGKRGSAAGSGSPQNRVSLLDEP